MTYYSYDGELYHFGIKNQKWGVRRFQNSDGTLTAAGKARYKQYKKDVKEYNKLNRHLGASQKHMKEEGVMLDRVRDSYLKKNIKYKKEMTKSEGFLGLKAAKKADRVARAQSELDSAGKDYEKASEGYGMARRIASNDANALINHTNNMIKTYGKGSIKDISTKQVKIGQNKFQKIMQGAPVLSTVFGRKRDTETVIDTGKTLADMPIIGNLYTANYVGNREFDIKQAKAREIIDRPSVTRDYSNKNPIKFLKDDYFDDVSSVSDKKEMYSRKATKAAKAAKNSLENKKKTTDSAKENLDEKTKSYDEAKNRAKDMGRIAANPLTPNYIKSIAATSAANASVDAARKKKEVKYAKKEAEKTEKDYNNSVKEAERLEKEAEKYKRKAYHSVITYRNGKTLVSASLNGGNQCQNLLSVFSMPGTLF